MAILGVMTLLQRGWSRRRWTAFETLFYWSEVMDKLMIAFSLLLNSVALFFIAGHRIKIKAIEDTLTESNDEPADE
jgi:hypothetical protein